MKAYEVKSGTKVKLLEDAKVPPGALSVKKGDIIKLYKLDGAYCNGISEDDKHLHIGDWTENGKLECVRVYIAAWTEVEILES